MELSFFWKGILLGFSIAAPVGPIGILCIRRTIQFGRLSGLFSGLGAALADMVFGAVGAFGLTIISKFLIEHHFWLRLIGGVFLFYLGVKIFLSRPQMQENGVKHKSLLGDFISTFFLTIGIRWPFSPIWLYLQVLDFLWGFPIRMQQLLFLEFYAALLFGGQF